MSKKNLISTDDAVCYFGDIAPLFPPAADRVKEFVSIEDLFHIYYFCPEYFDRYQCKPEIILLAISLFAYLEHYARFEELNATTVMFLLKQTTNYHESKTTLDLLFDSIQEDDDCAENIKSYYQMFKASCDSRQKDAVSALYEYYLYGAYAFLSTKSKKEGNV